MTERLSADEASIDRAAALLLEGEIVAFPTETVYGLGARADRAEAVKKIFAAKGRPKANPLIVHVASIEAARALAGEWTAVAEALASAFWPGPMTIVVARSSGVAEEVTAGGDSVALRVPDHPIARALLAKAGVPVAAPSANRSESVSPVTAEHVLKTLDGRIAAIVDGGRTGFGIESTIVDARGEEAVVLRAGAIDRDAIARLVRVVDRSAGVDRGGRAASPGRSAKHYAPRARIVIASPSEIDRVAAAHRDRGERVGVLAMPKDAETLARDLYADFHRFDDDGCEVIVIEEVPAGVVWDAVRDRIRRAAS